MPLGEVAPGGIRAMPGAQASGMEWVLTVLYCCTPFSCSFSVLGERYGLVGMWHKQ